MVLIEDPHGALTPWNSPAPPWRLAVVLATGPDTSLDGNSTPELGVMVNSDTSPQLRIRDSVTKNLIQTISLP